MKTTSGQKEKKTTRRLPSFPKALLFQLFKMLLAGLAGIGAFALAVEVVFQGVLYLSVYVGVTAEAPLTVLMIWGFLSLLLLAVVVKLLFFAVGWVWREIFRFRFGTKEN